MHLCVIVSLDRRTAIVHTMSYGLMGRLVRLWVRHPNVMHAIDMLE